MSGIANLTITTNPAGTDVNVNYGPKKASGGIEASWEDRTQGIILLQPLAAMRFSDAYRGNMRRVSGSLTLPFVDPNDSTKYLKGYFNAELVIPLISSSAQRKDLRTRATSFLANTVWSAAFETGDNVY